MEGPKDPFACGCEGDLDGVLTMQVLKLLTDQPVLFYDLRHYDPDEDIFVFSNCGAMSTYYAGCSASPRENLAKVTFYPQTPFYYPAGGAAVQFMCAPGEVTFARLARKNGKYWMIIFGGEFLSYPEEKLNETSPEWPQAFTKLKVDSEELIKNLPGNHVHTVYGNYIDELVLTCEILGIDYKVF